MLDGLKPVILSPEAGAKYELIASELQELASLSHMSWGLLSRNSYNLDLRIAFAAGAVAGLTAGKIISVGKCVCTKIRHSKNRDEKEA